MNVCIRNLDAVSVRTLVLGPQNSVFCFPVLNCQPLVHGKWCMWLFPQSGHCKTKQTCWSHAKICLTILNVPHFKFLLTKQSFFKLALSTANTHNVWLQCWPFEYQSINANKKYGLCVLLTWLDVHNKKKFEKWIVLAYNLQSFTKSKNFAWVY